MRVQVNGTPIVGEITQIKGDLLTISYVDHQVAGWSSELEYKTIVVDCSVCTALDEGLNSPYYLDISSLLKQLAPVDL